MGNFVDKCYHIACALPVVQTVVGGAAALKHIIGIIKDVAMVSIFKGYAEDIQKERESIKVRHGKLQIFQKEREYLFSISVSDTKCKDKAIKTMLEMQKSLSEMKLLFVLPDSVISIYANANELLKVNGLTATYLNSAITECKNQYENLSFASNMTTTVPPRERICSLASAVLSAIPVVGTVYNVGILGYYSFSK